MPAWATARIACSNCSTRCSPPRTGVRWYGSAWVRPSGVGGRAPAMHWRMGRSTCWPCAGSFTPTCPRPAASSERPLWALDGTHWPRPAAATSAERTYERRVATGRPRDGVVPAWADQWLVAVPEARGSWILPLDVRRRGPTVGLPTTLALAQLQAAMADRSPAAPRPVVTLDTGYDV